MSGVPGVTSERVLGRYTIERELGRGGTATVYLARDSESGGHVAVKMLRPELSAATAAKQFLREIRRTASLQHPRIVPVLDAGHDGERLYYVLPYMEGGTLRDRLQREKQLPVQDAIGIAKGIAEALDHAHQHGLIHRDVKPENILFTAGEACLADFGIARALEKSADDTSTSRGIVRGTLVYMSPEQASGEHEYDGRSDVFALGCVLYEMLAGVPAFIGATPEAALAQRFAHAPRDVRVYRSSVAAPLAEVLVRALQFSPADRFESAGAMALALGASEAATAQAGPSSASASAPAERRLRRAPGWMRRPRWRAGIVIAAAAIAVAVGLRYFAPSAPFRERDWIVVADFEGPDDDPQLADVVRELATAELNQSRFVSTLPRAQLGATMRLAGIPDTTRVGPQLARELAYRSAVRAVLTGSVRRIGSEAYSIVLQALDAESGGHIHSAAGAAADTNLIPMVQQLSREMREGLGERRSAIEAALPLDQIATPSFPAYRRYVEALRLQTRGDGRASNRILGEAIAMDTAFASAWLTMGWNYLNERMLDSARWAFRQALARKERMSELQRYRLEADVAYTLDYDVPAAIRAYDLFLAYSPRSWAVHNNRGLYLLALGRYEDGLASFERAVGAHPFGPRVAQIQLLNQAATLIALGRTAEAARTARDLTGPFAEYFRLMMAAATDRWLDIDSTATAIASAPSSPAWLRTQARAIAAGSRARRGALRESDQLLAVGEGDPSPDVARWFHRARLILAIAGDRPVPALPDALAEDVSAGGLVTAGLSAALRGDTVAAREALRRLSALPQGDLRRIGSGPRLVEGWVLARAGRWAEATAMIAGPAVDGEHDTAVLDRVGSLSLRWLAAEAYANRGQLDSATAMLELAIQPRRMPGNEFALRGLVENLAHHRLGRWHAAAGRPDDAARHWRLFLQSCTTPDPELVPLVTEARDAVDRLTAA